MNVSEFFHRYHPKEEEEEEKDRLVCVDCAFIAFLSHKLLPEVHFTCP